MEYASKLLITLRRVTDEQLSMVHKIVTKQEFIFTNKGNRRKRTKERLDCVTNIVHYLRFFYGYLDRITVDSLKSVIIRYGQKKEIDELIELFKDLHI